MVYLEIGTQDKAGHRVVIANCRQESEWCKEELQLFKQLSFEANLSRLEEGGAPQVFQEHPELSITYKGVDEEGYHRWIFKDLGATRLTWGPEGGLVIPPTRKL